MTERRAAKTSTSARITTAAATTNANAPTRMDPSSARIAQLATATRDGWTADARTRALKTMASTRARSTTAAATKNAYACRTRSIRRNVALAQLAMTSTGRRVANLTKELSTGFATMTKARSGLEGMESPPSRRAPSLARMQMTAIASRSTANNGVTKRDAATGKRCAGT